MLKLDFHQNELVASTEMRSNMRTHVGVPAVKLSYLQSFTGTANLPDFHPAVVLAKATIAASNR